jgi:hypothetical protein
MKAILKFDLENPEDRMSHLRCVKSSDMACFIWELKHNFWRKWKHDETDFNLDNYKEALYELMEEHNINTYELTE